MYENMNWYFGSKRHGRDGAFKSSSGNCLKHLTTTLLLFRVLKVYLMQVPLQSPTKLHHMVHCMVPLVRFNEFYGSRDVMSIYLCFCFFFVFLIELVVIFLS